MAIKPVPQSLVPRHNHAAPGRGGAGLTYFLAYVEPDREGSMTAASRPQVVTLRSGDVVRLRQVRPGDASALARAYADLGEQSRYRRFFTTMPKLPESTLKAAAKVDHENHEALVAVPLLSSEIVGECRFIRRADQPDSADAGVTVVDAWQGRGLGSALLIRLSERALELGIGYFTAEILAENRTMLALLPSLGRVETESLGPARNPALLPDPQGAGTGQERGGLKLGRPRRCRGRDRGTPASTSGNSGLTHPPRR
jgi:RimJ/RimL family protein N-acetyltransferase